MQKRLRDWTFKQYNHTPGSFDLTALLREINGWESKQEVPGEGRTLELQKLRSERVKGVLGW